MTTGNKKLITLLLMSCFPLTTNIAFGTVLTAYDPNDYNVVGIPPPTPAPIIINNNGSDTLTAADLSTIFPHGTEPAGQNHTLNDLNSGGSVTANTGNILDKYTISLGPQNHALAIKDPITGTNVTTQVYNTGSFTQSGSTIGDTNVKVYPGVLTDQYIGLTVAAIDSTGGTMNVDLGNSAGFLTDSTNTISIAAKESTLFTANGSSAPAIINWNNNNTVNFGGIHVDTTATSTYNTNSIPTYMGTFQFTTAAGNTYSQTVSNLTELKAYNDWLITELQAGNILGSEYTALFNKAVTFTPQSVTYKSTTASGSDEIFEPIGNRIAVSATGVNAQVNINANLQTNATIAVQLKDGAAGVVNAGNTVAATGTAFDLHDASHVINYGTIDSGFSIDASGNWAGGGNAGAKGVAITDSGYFTNSGTGVINIASNSGTGIAAGIYLNNSSAATAGYNVGGQFYSAGNDGIINVGVNTPSNASGTSGSTTGVEVASASSSFYNNNTIYLGRDTTGTDVAINQVGLLTGIRIDNSGTAVNNGAITLGTKVQNAAAMYAAGITSGGVNGDAATMVNSGTILLQSNSVITGVPNTNYGMLVNNAGKNGGIVNSGNIYLNGINGVGVKVVSTGNNFAAVSTTNTSVIDLQGDADPTSGTRNFGVWVEGQGANTALANIDGEIKLSGTGAIGVHARGKATVNVTNSAIPQFITGEKQIGFFAYGTGAEINLGNASSNMSVGTDKSTLFRIENGAVLSSFGNLGITTNGIASQGIVATGTGTTLILSNSPFVAAADDSTAVVVEGGAASRISDGSIQLNGAGTIGVIVDNKKHDLNGGETGRAATHVESSAHVTSLGSDVTAYIIQNGGDLTLFGSDGIDLAGGTGNTGVLINQSGNLNNISNLIYVADGTGVDVVGAGASASKLGVIKVDDGTAGVRLSDGATLNIAGSGNSITTDGTATGILLDTNAATLVAANTTVNVNGSGHGVQNNASATAQIGLNNVTINVANGNGIENTLESSQISLSNTNITVGNSNGIRTGVSIDPASTATIMVNGNGTGFAFQSATGAMVAGNLVMGNGYKITAAGAGATGIMANTSGMVLVDATVNVTDPGGGSALVAGTASQTINRGMLISNSTAAVPVVDLTNGTGTTFYNTGTISAASAAQTAVQGSASDDNLNFYAGTVRGIIDSGAGTNDTLFMQGTTFEGAIQMGATNNNATINSTNLSKTSHITALAGGDNVLTLNDIQARGGSFAADNLAKGTNLGNGWRTINLFSGSEWTLTDNLQLNGSEVYIDRSSVLYAGGNVKPVISSTGAVTVYNQGTIDLTNGGDMFTDSLTIRGNYDAEPNSTVGFGPRRLMLNTFLNQGGARANQHTDRLLIEGNATGVTVIDIKKNIGNASEGALTDLDYNQVISANEGISVVQVAGNSTAGAFVLKNGYVGAGAFSYDLYAFAPGTADAAQRVVAGAGNRFWDYRLANAFHCADGTTNCRPALIPQAPSYLSLATGVMSYNTQNIDDLHKRLGELRAEEFDNPKEVFARYIYSDYTYHTNVSHSNFGYNFDMDSNILQLGGNLIRVRNEDSLFKGGLAWSHGDSTLKPDALDGYSKTKINSDTLALYLTWHNKDNFYVDGMLSYDWHRAKVETKTYDRANTIKGDSWSASIESGYPFIFDNGFAIEPQVQLTYHDLTLKDSVDEDNARVQFDSYSQTIGRVGVRANRTWLSEDGKQYSPYARLNYYHSWGGSPTSRISDHNNTSSRAVSFSGGDFGQAVQVGLGLTTTFKNNLSVYGEVDYQKEINAGARGFRFNVGGKWLF